MIVVSVRINMMFYSAYIFIVFEAIVLCSVEIKLIYFVSTQACW